MAFGNDVNTMTPGSAVADSLEDILTRKRNEARQAMLDSITQQSAQARNEYMKQNSASLAQEREAKTQEYQQLADTRWKAGLGDNPSQVAPDTYQRGMRIAPGSFSATPAKTISASEFAMPNGFDQADPTNPVQPQSVNAPGTFNYLGSDKYRTRQQTIEGLNKLATDPSFSKAAQNELKLAAIDPQWNPEGAMARIMTSKADQAPGHEYIIDPAHPGKMIDAGAIGPNGHVNVLPREPEPAWANQPHYETFAVPDDPKNPTGPTHPETHMMIGNQRPDFSPNSKTRQGANLLGTNLPKQPAGGNLPFNKQELDKYTSITGNKKSTPAAKAQALRAFVGTLPDSGLRSSLQAMLDPQVMAKSKVNPFTLTAKQLTTPNASGEAPLSGLTAAQVEALDTILNSIRSAGTAPGQ